MKNVTLEQVTTYAARARHYVASTEQDALVRTLCGHRPVFLGGKVSSQRRLNAPVSPDLLESLPQCGDCERFARMRGLLRDPATPAPTSALTGSAPAADVAQQRVHRPPWPPRHS